MRSCHCSLLALRSDTSYCSLSTSVALAAGRYRYHIINLSHPISIISSMEPYLSPNNNTSLGADAEEEQNHRTRSPTIQHPIVMSSGRSMSRRSPNTSPYRSTHLHPSLPQSDARRLEQQIYAGMQQYPSRPGELSRGGVPFFGRHHPTTCTALELGEVYLASSAAHTYPASLGGRSSITASIQPGLLNDRSPPNEFLRRYHHGQHPEEPMLRVECESGGSPPDRAAELGLVVGTRAPSLPGMLSESVARSSNPTPSRLRGQPPGEDSYSAEYGALRHLHGPRPPHVSSQPLMASYTELETRHPSIYGPVAVTAVTMPDVPPRILEESFVRHHGPIAPSLHAADEISSDLSGNPYYGLRESTTRRSPPSYFPMEEEVEEDMPPLPPLPSARPLVQPYQEPEQAVEGKNRRRRQEVETDRRPRRQASRPSATAAQEIAIEVEMFHFPRPLGILSDAKYLTEFHCFLRSNLIEVFCATKDDMNGKLYVNIFNDLNKVSLARQMSSEWKPMIRSLYFRFFSLAPRRGRKKPVLLGQVGVRCMSCAVASRRSSAPEKRNGSTYYPTTIASIYNSVMLIQQRHFSECKAISTEARAEYSRLKQILGRSGAGKAR